jgi:hypothetical protein
MDSENEHRDAIKYCFKAGLYATETSVLMQTAYGNEALKRDQTFSVGIHDFETEGSW